MALGHIHLRFVWQMWHLWHWAGSGALGRAGARLVAGDAAQLCVAGVALKHPSSFRVAGVALGDIHFCVAGVALMALTLRGRRGTWRHPTSFRVAGVALGDIHLRSAW